MRKPDYPDRHMQIYVRGSYPEDNKYIEYYPHGVHFVHFNFEEAVKEANRLNAIDNKEV